MRAVNPRQLAAFLAIVLAAPSAASPASAAQHLWRIKEVYSSANGAVQFIELYTTGDGEFFLNFHSMTAQSDSETPVTYNFTHDLDGETTENRHFLIATAGFQSLPGGVTPDYTNLPANFFKPNATSITINFSFYDQVTFAGSLLPKDGVNSLTDLNPFGVQNLVAGPNSPTNFAGALGGVNVAPFAAADFTENGAVNAADLTRWSTNFGLTGNATHQQGDSDNDKDVDGADFLKWQQQTTSTGSLAPVAGVVPEPASAALSAIAAAGTAPLIRRRRARA